MNVPATLNLETERVQLRLLTAADFALLPVALDPDTWKFTVTRISDSSEFYEWMEKCLHDIALQTRFTFVITDKETGEPAGSTSFGNITAVDKRLEIGWTWLGKKYRGSGLNRHCKFLLLTYAFEELQFERVELKTDVLNVRSRKAMLKIGATEEGVLRSHTLMHDGRRRDTIYYSILRPEWPIIKTTIFKDLS